MVHVKKCPFKKRGNPSTEFHLNGKPQIYCEGWTDKMTDEPISICKKCKDWNRGEQVEIDFRQAKRLEASNV